MYVTYFTVLLQQVFHNPQGGMTLPLKPLSKVVQQSKKVDVLQR